MNLRNVDLIRDAEQYTRSRITEEFGPSPSTLRRWVIAGRLQPSTTNPRLIPGRNLRAAIELRHMPGLSPKRNANPSEVRVSKEVAHGPSRGSGSTTLREGASATSNT